METNELLLYLTKKLDSGEIEIASDLNEGVKRNIVLKEKGQPI
jgi:hypothetical protein